MELKIKKETAKTVYEESPSWFQKVLTETFGKACFKTTDFNDIKTFNDACVACGTTEQAFELKFKDLNLDLDTVFYEKLKMVAKAINQGWVPDWSNSSQRKWYPYFEVAPSGAGFSDSDYLCTFAYAGVGSRLCFESEAKAIHAGKQFTSIYSQFIL